MVNVQPGKIIVINTNWQKDRFYCYSTCSQATENCLKQFSTFKGERAFVSIFRQISFSSEVCAHIQTHRLTLLDMPIGRQIRTWQFRHLGRMHIRSTTHEHIDAQYLPSVRCCFYLNGVLCACQCVCVIHMKIWIVFETERSRAE